MDTKTITATPSLLEIETRHDDQALWIFIRGEADLSNHQKIEAALSDVDLAGARRVNLALSDLRFCDVRTICSLLNFALEVRDQDCDVAVMDANPLVRLMTRLLAVDEELRFESAHTIQC